MAFTTAGIMAAAAAASAVGAGASARSQHKQRGAVRRANEEQKERDAFTNLMSVTSGQGPRDGQPIQAAPEVDYGATISALGGVASSVADSQIQSKNAAAASKLKTDTLAETVRHNTAAEGIASNKPASGSPSFKQANDMLQGKNSEIVDMVNVIRAEKGIAPMELPGSQLSEVAKEKLYKLWPSLRPVEEETGDFLSLGF